MTGFRSHWTELEACYRGDLTKAYSDPFQNQLLSNLWFHKTHSTLETVMVATISDLPTVDIRGRASALDEQVAMGYNAVMPFYLERMNFFIELMFWWRNALKFGWAPMQIDWRFETVRKKVRNELGERVWDDNVVAYDQPWCKALNPFRCWPDTSATCSDDMAFFINEELVSENYVVDNLKAGKFKTDDLDKIMMGANLEEPSDTAIKTVRGMQGVGDNPVWRSETLSPLHRKTNYWGLFDIDQDGRDEQCLIRLINGECVQVEENEYGRIPIRDACYIPVAEDFVGISLVELVQSLQREMNKRANHRIDAEDLILNPMVVVRRGGRVLNSQLRMRPGGRVDASNIEDIKYLDSPIEILNAGINSHQVLEGMWQDVSGVPAIMAGLDTKLATTNANRTFSGMAMVQQKAESKMMFYRRLFEVRSLTPAFQDMIDLISEFQSDPIFVRLTDNQFGPMKFTLTPEMLYGASVDLKVSIRPQEIMNRLVEREKFLSIIFTLMKIPGAERRNWDYLAKKWLNAENLYDAEQILGPPAPPMPAMGGPPNAGPQGPSQEQPANAPQMSEEEFNQSMSGMMFPGMQGAEVGQGETAFA